jgi:uroporphyrin-3 C-methyltransferase
MTMSEQAEKVEQRSPTRHPPKPSPRPQNSGSSGAFLAMVIALAAGAGSYYVWQQHLTAEQDRQALRRSIEQLLEVVNEKDRDQQARIEQLADHHHANLEQRLDTLEQSLPELGRQLSLQQRDWSLAEVDYLLRLADHSLQLSHDIPSAITALRQGHEQLIRYGNGHYADVAANIAQTIQILTSLAQSDTAPVITRLGELLTSLDALPYGALATPADTPQPDAASGAKGVADGAPLVERLQYWGGMMWRDIKSLVTIRRNDGSGRPLMNPQQRYLLQEQLRLTLESARLAALAHNQSLYAASLQQATRSLSRNYDTSSSAVSDALTILSQLAAINIDPELPSLQGLRLQLNAARPMPPASQPATAVPAPAALPAVGEEPGAERLP